MYIQQLIKRQSITMTYNKETVSNSHKLLNDANIDTGKTKHNDDTINSKWLWQGIAELEKKQLRQELLNAKAFTLLEYECPTQAFPNIESSQRNIMKFENLSLKCQLWIG